MPMKSELQAAVKETARLLEEKMDTLLPKEGMGRIGEDRLAKAMRYAVFSSGKRLRPFLVVATAGLFGVSQSAALQAASAIEFIHTYSLIHDDLPALDNDDMRRGKPSCHKAFDEATAILAGDALLTLAFDVLSDPTTHTDAKVTSELVKAVAEAIGTRGMVGGQMIDLISEREKLSIDEITRLQRMKTGALFGVACEAGAILGKAPAPLRSGLRGYARDIGLAFQITDDLLDAESEEGSGRHDKSSGKGTYVSVLGVEQARTQARMLAQQAVAHLHSFGKKADVLKELAGFVVDRDR